MNRRIRTYDYQADMKLAQDQISSKGYDTKKFYLKFWDNVKDLFKDLCKREIRITKEEFFKLTGNSYDFKVIYPNVDNEALLAIAEYMLKNISYSENLRYKLSPSYEQVVVSELVPIMMDRIEELEAINKELLMKMPPRELVISANKEQS